MPKTVHGRQDMPASVLEEPGSCFVAFWLAVLLWFETREHGARSRLPRSFWSTAPFNEGSPARQVRPEPTRMSGPLASEAPHGPEPGLAVGGDRPTDED